MAVLADILIQISAPPLPQQTQLLSTMTTHYPLENERTGHTSHHMRSYAEVEKMKL